MVMDAVSQAARNVSILLNRKLEIPPIPIKSVRKQDDTNVTDQQSPMYDTIQPINIVTVFEVWKIFLEKNEENLDEVYVIISGDNTLQGYRNGKWSNIQYQGFYSTAEEAINEVGGYLE